MILSLQQGLLMDQMKSLHCSRLPLSSLVYITSLSSHILIVTTARLNATIVKLTTNSITAIFFSFCDDLNQQLKDHLARSNNRPMRLLGCLSPVEYHSNYRVQNPTELKELVRKSV